MISWPPLLFVGLLILPLLWLGLQPGFYYLEGFFFVIIGWATFAIGFLSTIAWNAIRFAAPRNPLADAKPQLFRWFGPFCVMAFVTMLLFFKIPLRAGFLTAQPTLTEILTDGPPSDFKGIDTDLDAGVYKISAERTNGRFQRDLAGAANRDRILFILATDSEAAFIYSPGGIKDLSYNSGNKGHLFSHWYWMKED